MIRVRKAQRNLWRAPWLWRSQASCSERLWIQWRGSFTPKERHVSRRGSPANHLWNYTVKLMCTYWNLQPFVKQSVLDKLHNCSKLCAGSATAFCSTAVVPFWLANAAYKAKVAMPSVGSAGEPRRNQTKSIRSSCTMSTGIETLKPPETWTISNFPWWESCFVHI